MADVSHAWGSDWTPSPTGALALTSGADEAEQRILRRLLTNPGDYPWHPGFGAGLGRFVGSPANTGRIAAVVRRQVLLDEAVAPSPEPKVTVRGDTSGHVYLSIVWSYAATGESRATEVTITG